MKYQLILLLSLFIILGGCSSVSVNTSFNETINVKDGGIVTLPDDITFRISRGDIPGFTRILVSGHDSDVTSTENLISSIPTFTLPTTAAILNISSNDINDNIAGTGARQVLVQGLNSSWDLIQEVVDLSGTTTVSTTNSYLRVNNIIVISAGSSFTNEGTITTIHPQTTISVINPTIGQDLNAIYSIPRGHTLFLNSILAGAGKNENVDFKFRARSNGVDFVSSRIALFQNANDYESYIPSPLPEMTDIYITGQKTGTGGIANADIIAQFFLVSDEALDNYPETQ